MVAFLQLAPTRDTRPTTAIVGKLDRAVQASLSQPKGVRPTLVCRWLQDADGRLSCYWDIDLPDLPIPPD